MTNLSYDFQLLPGLANLQPHRASLPARSLPGFSTNSNKRQTSSKIFPFHPFQGLGTNIEAETRSRRTCLLWVKFQLFKNLLCILKPGYTQNFMSILRNGENMRIAYFSIISWFQRHWQSATNEQCLFKAHNFWLMMLELFFQQEKVE